MKGSQSKLGEKCCRENFWRQNYGFQLPHREVVSRLVGNQMELQVLHDHG